VNVDVGKPPESNLQLPDRATMSPPHQTRWTSSCRPTAKCT